MTAGLTFYPIRLSLHFNYSPLWRNMPTILHREMLAHLLTHFLLSKFVENHKIMRVPLI